MAQDGDQCSVPSTGCRRTPSGTTGSRSTSTSTATPAPGSAPPIKPVGPASWPTSSRRAGSNSQPLAPVDVTHVGQCELGREAGHEGAHAVEDGPPFSFVHGRDVAD